MAFLSAESFYLDNRETLNADVLKGFFHFVQFERFDNGFDLFHLDTR